MISWSLFVRSKTSDEAITHLAVGIATEAVLSRCPKAVVTLSSKALRSKHVDRRFVDVASHVGHASVVIGVTKAAVEAVTRAAREPVGVGDGEVWAIESAANDLDLTTTTCTTGAAVLKGTDDTSRHVATRFDSHDLACDATTVRSVLDAWQERTNGVEHHLLGLRVGVVDGGLDDVVGEAVTQHLLSLVATKHLSDQQLLNALVCSTKTLLNDVGRELLL